MNIISTRIASALAGAALLASVGTAYAVDVGAGVSAARSNGVNGGLGASIGGSGGTNAGAGRLDRRNERRQCAPEPRSAARVAQCRTVRRADRMA